MGSKIAYVRVSERPYLYPYTLGPRDPLITIRSQRIPKNRPSDPDKDPFPDMREIKYS